MNVIIDAFSQFLFKNFLRPLLLLLIVLNVSPSFGAPATCRSVMYQIAKLDEKSDSASLLAWMLRENASDLKKLKSPNGKADGTNKILRLIADIKVNMGVEDSGVIIRNLGSQREAATFFYNWANLIETNVIPSNQAASKASIEDPAITKLKKSYVFIRKGGNIAAAVLVASMIFPAVLTLDMASFLSVELREKMLLATTLLGDTSFAILIYSIIASHTTKTLLKNKLHENSALHEDTASLSNESQFITGAREEQVELMGSPPRNLRISYLESSLPETFNSYPTEWKSIKPRRFRMAFVSGPDGEQFRSAVIAMPLY